tara:strand:- start:122 stop:1336 length:1215 start_codon:yes stop_codon:yes gene_type:complete
VIQSITSQYKIEILFHHISEDTTKTYSKERASKQASKQAIMSSTQTTQTIGRTYKKVASSWDKKRGTRDCHANVFNATTAKEPLYHVASLMNRVLCDLHNRADIAEELERVEPNVVMVAPSISKASISKASIWVYDMRASDAAPRTEQDAARLKWFVTLLVKKHTDPHTQAYLLQHITISMCFFAWFFSTPNYFYATKEMRQTTRFGIQKIWTETLLRKRPTPTPTPTPKPTPNTKTRSSSGAMHQKDSILPKLEEEKRAIETKIDALVKSEHPTHVFDWADARGVHTKVSECFDMNGKNYINGKKSKKLQTLYQDYQRVHDKVARTKKGIASAQVQHQRTEKQRTEKQRTEKQRTLPPPPPAQEDDVKYIDGQIWLQGKDGGWCVEETKEEAQEDIPESWEDL